MIVLHSTDNTAGDLTQDGNKGLTKIHYDYLGHPVRVQFSDGSCTEYVYAADGRKLREKHTTAVEGLTVRMGNTLKLTPEQTMAVWQKKFLFKIDYRLQGSASQAQRARRRQRTRRSVAEPRIVYRLWISV